MLRMVLCIPALALVLGACGDDDSMVRDSGASPSDSGLGPADSGPGPSDAGEEDPAEAACEEIAAPGDPIAAGAVADATAPLVTIGAEPYLVTLPASGSGFVRVVTTEAETTAIAFFRASGVLTRILEADGSTEVTLMSAGANEFCMTDIPEHFDLDFETAGAFYLELTSASDAWFFLSSAEGHAH
jgi:hypothetical protein